MPDKIRATNFCGTLAANVDNEKMSDVEFRAFVRSTLGIVDLTERTYNEGVQDCRDSLPQLQAAIEKQTRQLFRARIRELDR
jgi:hypothetical protein